MEKTEYPNYPADGVFNEKRNQASNFWHTAKRRLAIQIVPHREITNLPNNSATRYLRVCAARDLIFLYSNTFQSQPTSRPRYISSIIRAAKQLHQMTEQALAKEAPSCSQDSSACGKPSVARYFQPDGASARASGDQQEAARRHFKECRWSLERIPAHPIRPRDPRL